MPCTLWMTTVQIAQTWWHRSRFVATAAGQVLWLCSLLPMLRGIQGLREQTQQVSQTQFLPSKPSHPMMVQPLANGQNLHLRQCEPVSALRLALSRTGRPSDRCPDCMPRRYATAAGEGTWLQ